MTKRYYDEGVTKLITVAKVSKTKNNAMILEEAQVKYWLTRGKSVRDVFKLLKLKTAGDNLLTSPLFNSWSIYVKSYNMAHSDKKSSLVDFLITKYGEDGVSKLVEAALKVKRSSIIAKRVQAEQFQRWIASKKSLWEVFALLKLNRAGAKLLENPLLNTFAKFTNTVNEQFKQDLEKGLVKMRKIAVAAKYAPGSSMIATNSERALFQLWFVAECDPDMVFTRLDLYEAGGNLLASPLFTTFLKFTDTYHANFPDKSMDTYEIVFAHYDGVQVVRMILAGKKVLSTRDAAIRMEAAVLQFWMHHMRSPDYAFQVLRLNEVSSPTQLFRSSLFMYWMNYLGKFAKAFPGKQIRRTILATIYKDEDLMDAIAAAQKNSETKDVAEKLKTELFEQFIFAKKDPVDVANLLHVKDETDNNWSFWKRYDQDYHKYHDRDMKNWPYRRV